MSTLSSHNPSILEQRAKLLSPRPAELVTLPSMHCHDHSYTQIVIGLKVRLNLKSVGWEYRRPGQGCVVTSGSDHAFGGIIGQSDILVLNMPLPSNDDPLMLQKINDLSNADVYFQLDGQIQKLVQMLVQEMQNSPEDMLLSRACSDTVLALLQRHISAFETHRRESRFDLEAIDRYIEQHISSRISVAQLAGSVFLGEPVSYAV